MKVLKFSKISTAVEKVLGKTKTIDNCTNVIKQSSLERSPNADNLLLTGTLSKNTLTLKQGRFLKSNYQIKDDGKTIGYASVFFKKTDVAPKGFFPKSWYIEGGLPDKNGNFPMKPYMYLLELAINDRMGKAVLAKRDKKYGAMAMQRLLQLAKNNGCETRIRLLAGKLGDTKFHPGKFYNKMGFELSPKIIDDIKAQESSYYRDLNLLKEKSFSEEEIAQKLSEKYGAKPKMENERYFYDEGYNNMFLVCPQSIVNYPI